MSAHVHIVHCSTDFIFCVILLIYFPESLRLHPPFPIINRTCSKNFKIPGTNFLIEEGTNILFSAIGLQTDPKYYNEPKKFKPERHGEVQIIGKNNIDCPNLVFGDGPRNCLGMRLGKLQSKIAIILLLQKFKFELDDIHKNTELKIHPINNVLASKNGINLKVFRR